MESRSPFEVINPERIDTFLRTVCSASPGIEDGRIKKCLFDLQITMLNLQRLRILSILSKQQADKVERLQTAFRNMGKSASSIGTAPSAMRDDLLTQCQKTLAMTEESMDDWFKTIEQIEVVAQRALEQAKALGWTIHKQPVFCYEEARQAIETRIGEEAAKFRKSLEDSLGRGNQSAENAIASRTRQGTRSKSGRTQVSEESQHHQERDAELRMLASIAASAAATAKAAQASAAAAESSAAASANDKKKHYLNDAYS